MKRIDWPVLGGVALVIGAPLAFMAGCWQHMARQAREHPPVVQVAPAVDLDTAPAPVIIENNTSHTVDHLLLGGAMGYMAGRAGSAPSRTIIEHHYVTSPAPRYYYTQKTYPRAPSSSRQRSPKPGRR